MSYSKEHKEHIEYTFAAFCKVVLRNAALSAYRDIGRRRKHEISLDYLISERYYNPSVTDNYFEEPIQPTIFSVCGERIEIENERLAKAFSILSKQRQEVLVLYAISVRQTRDSLTASFRFHLTVDTLAVRLYISHYLGMFGTYTR